ncbi:hypothetical protein OK074_5235 [Actinobacteria bacterium OK074]|nr:hypothetical protein OK074_5235 [Actinobacteria bacterium OK074]
MFPHTPRPALAEADIHDLVRRWLADVNGRRSAERLPEFTAASGFALHLPDRIIRGREEFAAWCAGHTGPRPGTAGRISAVEVSVLSPLHADVSFTSDFTFDRTARQPLRHEWSVVHQQGAPRIRFWAVKTLAPHTAPQVLAA